MSHINIVQINAALGVLLSGSFIEAPQPEGLGVKRDEVPGAAKRAVFWKASDFPTIVDRFGAYIASRRDINAASLSGERPKKASDAPAGTPVGASAATTPTGQGVVDPFASAPADPFAEAASTPVDPFA